MFEARLSSASVLKKIVDAVKDLVTEGNLDATGTGITLQAMDSSHVSLVALKLDSDGFEHYRCDRNVSLGLNFASLAKMLKCAGNDDVLTFKAEDGGDVCTFLFESTGQDRLSEFELKMMDIDCERLGIPPEEYHSTVKMPSNEFQRICRDLAVLGDTAVIKVSKAGIKFSVSGDVGTGSITHKHGAGVSSEKPEEGVYVACEEPVELTFALRYLNFFAKATPLSPVVTLSMSADVPLAVEYEVAEMGHVRFYLAPKIDDEA